jgi:hypothetical protein
LSEIRKRIYPETHEEWLKSMRAFRGWPMFGFRRISDAEAERIAPRQSLAKVMAQDYPAQADGSVPAIESK